MLDEDRVLNGLSLLVLGVLAAGVVGWMLFIGRHPGYGGAEDCRAAYRRAHTPADSAIVDARVPVVGRSKELTVLTCGVLRRSGEVR
jgi:hypothetical protein